MVPHFKKERLRKIRNGEHRLVKLGNEGKLLEHVMEDILDA